MKKQTSMVKTADIKRVWHLLDCKDQTLGRLSTKDCWLTNWQRQSRLHSTHGYG